MNYFSSDGFLGAAKDAHFPNRSGEARLVTVAGKRFRVLVIGRRRAVDDIPFLDFVEECTDEPTSRAQALPLLRAVSHGAVTTQEWFERNMSGSFQPSPYVDWTRFSLWSEYLKSLASNTTTRPFCSTLTRRRKKLAKEIGPVVYAFHEQDIEVLHAAMRWKSAQYVSSKYLDLFAAPKNVLLFETLFRQGLLTLSTLRAKDRLVAAHVGMVWQDRWYSWVPAYDAELISYSPGVLLLEDMLKDSYDKKHKEYDFLVGGESYKWPVATHVRLIGPIGTAPLYERAWRMARVHLIKQVRQRPVLYARLQDYKRRALQAMISRS